MKADALRMGVHNGLYAEGHDASWQGMAHVDVAQNGQRRIVDHFFQ